jgi:iron complex transport system substrate-binding protein
MLGYGDRMPATINAVSRDLLLQSIAPALADSVVVKSGGSLNAETILEKKTDLIIIGIETYLDTDERAKLDVMGIPYLVVRYTNMQEQMDVVSLLGRALQAEETADAYNAYYQRCIDLVSEGSASVPAAEIRRMYHSVNEATRTDYVGSLCADWIALTRVINVSLDTDLSFEEDKAYATLEQIYAWDPDLIICNESGVADYILSDSKWQGLRAVINQTVYQIPIGISRWGHPTSVETPLAILWLGKLLYPDRFEIDVRAEMTQFYRDFFHYELSADEADGIISGYGVRTPKTQTLN